MGGVGAAAPSAAAVKGSKEIVKWVGKIRFSFTFLILFY